ncbi:MAG: family 10 glycosylhydrolase [Kiritimatiellaeota bacterium]|nr:family 10 glycosylhydrolase [Kiritimatiellota bacterium]
MNLLAFILVAGVTGGANPQPKVGLLQGLGENRAERSALRWTLQAAAIPYSVVAPQETPSVSVTMMPLLIVPGSGRIPENVQLVLNQYIVDGGKLIGFYKAPETVLDLFGVFKGRYIKELGDAFYAIYLEQDLLPLTPEKVIQRSWNIIDVKPWPGTVVAGWWGGCRGNSGEEVRYPALLLNGNGAWFTHVLTSEDLAGKARLLQALAIQLAPCLSKSIAQAFVKESQSVGRFDTLQEFEQAIEAGAGKSSKVEDRTTAFKAGRELLDKAETALAAGKSIDSLKASWQSRELLHREYFRLWSSKTPELRGIYVPSNAWKIESDKTCSALAQNGFNAAFLYVGSLGGTAYDSAYAPVSPRITDPEHWLQGWMSAAKQNGISLHLWRNLFNLGDAPPDVIARMKQARRLVTTASGASVKFLCPVNPLNQRAEVDATIELLKKFRPEGVHFDYLRVPNWPPTYCYCDCCRTRFEKAIGTKIDPWPGAVLKGKLAETYRHWQTQQLTDFLRNLSKSIRGVDPKVKISAAIFGWPKPREQVGQDSDTWLKEGLLDFPVFMDYTENDPYFASLVKLQAPLPGSKTPTCVAIGAFSHAAWFESPVQLIDQILLTRQQGAKGFVVYHLTPTLLNNFLPALSAGVTSKPASLPWSAPRVLAP